MPKKITIRVQVGDEKTRSKAMKIAAVRPGVTSVSMEGDGKDQLVVTGDGVDSVELGNVLRKKLGGATIVSVQDVKKKKKKKNKEEEEDDDDDDDGVGSMQYIGYCNPYPPPTPYYGGVVYDSPNNSCSIM